MVWSVAASLTLGKSRALLEDGSNGIQDAIYNVILNQGKGTIVSIDDWNKSDFEQTIGAYPNPSFGSSTLITKHAPAHSAEASNGAP